MYTAYCCAVCLYDQFHICTWLMERKWNIWTPMLNTLFCVFQFHAIGHGRPSSLCNVFMNILKPACAEPHLFTIPTPNPNITAVHSCILQLHTCTAASRPRMIASDFMLYYKAAQLNTHRTVEGICTFFAVKSSTHRHVVLSFQRKIRLKIQIHFISNCQ
jgi:hypothetical protein